MPGSPAKDGNHRVGRWSILVSRFRTLHNRCIRTTNDHDVARLSKHGQLDYVFVRNGLDSMASFAPGAQTPADYKDLESLFLQYLRHTGASGFARSSAVEINLALFGKPLHFLFNVVRFKADGTCDPLGIGVVITMAANIGDQNAARLSRG